mgnify:CR=1 FL=1
MNIVFDIFPSYGHQHASYKLAKILKDEGHNIYYIGYLKYFKNLPEEFERRFIQPHIFSFIENKNINLWRKIKLAFGEKRNREMYKHNCQIIEKYDEMILDLKPDIIFVDHHYVQKSVLYYKYGVLIISIQTAPASEMDFTVPPFFSSHIPTGSFSSLVYIKFLWWNYLLMKKLKCLRNRIIYLGEDHLSEVERLAMKTGFPLKEQIDFNHYKGYGEFGLKNIPQLLLSPRDFDFPHPLIKNQYAVGPLLYINKQMEILDKRYLRVIEFIQNERKKKNIYLIYCSLGTLNDFDLQNSVKIFQLVIGVARKNKNYRFIISIGEFVDPAYLLPTPNNVFLFKLIPQIHQLTFCDIMIAHGGQNSITECIMNEVPLLIYPFFKGSDLGGNSARVVYHGIGNRGFINEDTIEEMEGKIKDLLLNPIYRENIHKMKLTLEKKNNSQEVLMIIRRLFNEFNKKENE